MMEEKEITPGAPSTNAATSESWPARTLFRWLFAASLFLVFGGAFAWGVWTVIRGPETHDLKALPILRPQAVMDFSLTERDGRAVTRADLLGKVWLASFVFTRCTGPCPELALRVRSLQQALLNHPPDVLLVTFSLEPENDSPGVLNSYAERYHADPRRWWFLTGGREADMHRLIRDGFLQTVVPATQSEALTHSTYFVLVDRQARLRAVYDGTDARSKDRILRDIDALLREPADGP
jgi:protein SCO1/2